MCVCVFVGGGGGGGIGRLFCFFNFSCMQTSLLFLVVVFESVPFFPLLFRRFFSFFFFLSCFFQFFRHGVHNHELPYVHNHIYLQ